MHLDGKTLNEDYKMVKEERDSSEILNWRKIDNHRIQQDKRNASNEQLTVIII